MDIFLLGLLTCTVALTIGAVIYKYLKMPWMFTVILLGMALTGLGLFSETLASPGFALLSRLGMLLFLFTIGVDLDLTEVRSMGARIIVGDILLVLTEGLALALFFYFVFPQFVHHSFLVALVVGVAFGTVGEVILLAILKEFHLENSRFGQLALGIGVFDDVFEILMLALAIGLPAFMGVAGAGDASSTIQALLGTLVGITLLTALLGWAKKPLQTALKKVKPDTHVGPFILFALLYGFLYLGSRSFDNLAVVAAIFAGIAIKQVLPAPLMQQFKRPVYFVANIFLGPFFFLSLGGKMSLDALATYPLAILAVTAISLTVRIALSYLLFRKVVGGKASLVLGVGVSAKMSTSVITENLLLTSGMLGAPLYAVLMGAFILMKPLIIGAFSRGAGWIAASEGVTPPQPTPVVVALKPVAVAPETDAE